MPSKIPAQMNKTRAPAKATARLGGRQRPPPSPETETAGLLEWLPPRTHLLRTPRPRGSGGQPRASPSCGLTQPRGSGGRPWWHLLVASEAWSPKALSLVFKMCTSYHFCFTLPERPGGKRPRCHLFWPEQRLAQGHSAPSVPERQMGTRNSVAPCSVFLPKPLAFRQVHNSGNSARPSGPMPAVLSTLCCRVSWPSEHWTLGPLQV